MQRQQELREVDGAAAVGVEGAEGVGTAARVNKNRILPLIFVNIQHKISKFYLSVAVDAGTSTSIYQE